MAYGERERRDIGRGAWRSSALQLGGRRRLEDNTVPRVPGLAGRLARRGGGLAGGERRAGAAGVHLAEPRASGAGGSVRRGERTAAPPEFAGSSPPSDCWRGVCANLPELGGPQGEPRVPGALGPRWLPGAFLPGQPPERDGAPGGRRCVCVCVCGRPGCSQLTTQVNWVGRGAAGLKNGVLASSG